MRALFEKGLIAANKQHLAETKTGAAASRRLTGTPAPAIDMPMARARLHAALDASNFQRKLTPLGAHKESELSDADI